MVNQTGKQQAASVQDQEEIQAVLKGNFNTSQRIRILNGMGLSTMAISILLEKRYQHVRNVLMTKLAGQ